MNLEHRHEHMDYNMDHHDKNHSSVSSEVNVEWKVLPESILPNQDFEILLTIKDNNGIPAPSFAVVHEKQMHLLAISEDLSTFQHLHPNYRGEGVFVVNTRFPKAGRYKLFIDFMPEGGSQQLATFEILTTGKEPKELVKPDRELKKTVNDLHFELKIENLAPKKHLKMIFTVKDANNQSPITDLQTYLGSAGHVVIVSEDLEKFLHVHPTDETTTGPAVSYMTTFPVPGLYKLWGQFKHRDKLYTVPFVIHVPHGYI